MKWFLVFWLWHPGLSGDGATVTGGWGAGRDEQRIEMPSQAECEEIKNLLKAAFDAECWAKQPAKIDNH
jgi:hypothetical protein